MSLGPSDTLSVVGFRYSKGQVNLPGISNVFPSPKSDDVPAHLCMKCFQYKFLTAFESLDCLSCVIIKYTGHVNLHRKQSSR
jgi:hypothetical protein